LDAEDRRSRDKEGWVWWNGVGTAGIGEASTIGRGDGGASIRASFGERTTDGEDDAECYGGGENDGDPAERTLAFRKKAWNETDLVVVVRMMAKSPVGSRRKRRLC